MSFAESAKKGLDAKRKAAEARAELDNVLAEASREVSEVMKSEVTLRFTKTRRALPQNTFAKIAAMVSPTKEVEVLEIQGAGGRFRHLCDVQFSELIYPLELTWGDRSQLVGDREGFVKAVQTLLESPATGEAILYVSKLEDQPTSE